MNDESFPGVRVLLDHAVRVSDAQLASISEIRAKTRTYVGAGGVSVTVAAGLLGLTDPPEIAIAGAVAGVVAFIVIAALGTAVDLAVVVPIAPNLEEFRRHVESGQWNEEALVRWMAEEYTRAPTEDSEDGPGLLLSVGPWVSLTTWLSNIQLYVFIFEVGVLATSLIVAVH